jgi:hypothetical protein
MDAVRLTAARFELYVHGIQIRPFRERPSVEMNLEVDDSVSPDQLRERTARFERALREEIPHLELVITRSEPVRVETAAVPDLEAELVA